ncbi:Leishmanolysin-like peptidase [Lamellibrachia satsuma]|nr:Leishmanolysin-like peptidase [Lamellibrachia satsuma]
MATCLCIRCTTQETENGHSVLDINSRGLKVKIDTGASYNVMSKHPCDVRNARQPTCIRLGRTKLQSYGGHRLTVQGNASFTVEYKRKYYPVDSVIGRENALTILGLSSVELGLISRIDGVISAGKLVDDYRDVICLLGCLNGEQHIQLRLGRRSRISCSYGERRSVQPHRRGPTAEEIFAKLHSSRYFNTFDATSGFMQIALVEESWYLATVATPFGRKFRGNSGPFMWLLGGNLVYLVGMMAAVEAEVFHRWNYHINDDNEVIHTYLGEAPHVVKRRSIDQKMRLFVYYDPVSIPALPAAGRNIIKNVLIPEAVTYFRNTLKVRSSSVNIRLFRSCSTYHVYYIRGDIRPYCGRGCRATTKCGSTTVPADHLTACYKVQYNRRAQEGVDAAGVDTDYVLYVSAVNTANCAGTVVAYARHCQLERALDRPVAGYINICPGGIGTRPQNLHFEKATIKHEIYHALGFARSLYRFYRDRNGDPLTRRNAASGLPVIAGGGWSSNVTREFARNWAVRSGIMQHTVTMFVMPTLIREARRHFGCDTLEGAELENQGSAGSKLSHWEKRVFGNEAMTSTFTQYPVFSRMTLALMEDTGWYKVNYKMAEELRWGFGLGCGFAQGSCLQYMQSRRAAAQSFLPYCDTVRPSSGGMKTCSLERKAINFCNLKKHNQELDTEYQYFNNLAGVPAADIGFYGGQTFFADYCPFTMTVAYRLASGVTTGTQCFVPGNAPASSLNYHMEVYDPNSRCLLHDSTWAVVFSPTSRQDLTGGGAGCYNITCSGSETTGFTVDVGGSMYRCSRTGDVIAVRGQVAHLPIQGTVVCPSYQDVCSPLKGPTYSTDVEWDGPPGKATETIPKN